MFAHAQQRLVYALGPLSSRGRHFVLQSAQRSFAITLRFVCACSAAVRLRRAFAVADGILASLAVRLALYYYHCWFRPRRPRRAGPSSCHSRPMYAAAAAIVTECLLKQGSTMRAASSRSALALLLLELAHPFSAVQ